MQQKYFDLLDKVEILIEDKEQDDEFVDRLYDSVSDIGQLLEEIEKDLAILKKDAHPPIFNTEDYRDILKRLRNLENGKKGSKNT